MGRGCCCTTPAGCKKSSGCSPWFFTNYNYYHGMYNLFNVSASFTKNQVNIIQFPKTTFGYEFDTKSILSSGLDNINGFHDLCSDSDLNELYFIPLIFNIGSAYRFFICYLPNSFLSQNLLPNLNVKFYPNDILLCNSIYSLAFYNNYYYFYYYYYTNYSYTYYSSWIQKIFKLKKGTYNLKLSNMMLTSMISGDMCSGGKIRCSNTGNTVNGYYFQGNYNPYAKIISGTQTKPFIANYPGRLSSYCNIRYPKESPYFASSFYSNTGFEELNPNGEYILDISEDTHVSFILSPLYKFKIEQKFKDSNLGKILTYFKLYNTPNDKTESIFNISGDGIECTDDIAVLNAGYYYNSSPNTICGNYFEGQ